MPRKRSKGAELRAEILKALPAGMELDEREAALLDLAARQADDVARLEAEIAKRGTTVAGSRGQPVLNPALAEARQGRLALGKLLAGLELPDAAGKLRSGTSRRAQGGGGCALEASRMMARFVGSGARSAVEALLDKLGLSDEPRLRELAADALDPQNPLRDVDLLALENLASDTGGDGRSRK